MIKLLADENFPLASVEILENKKYDILSISRSYSGISDTEIIYLANREQRPILTFDRDFGQLIFKI
jgi:predicted nuclease of predicted toxin-antitoxin system